jgi:ABC-type amino acid transport substrate-binding protein
LRASYLGWLLASLLPLGAAHGESYVVGVERLSFQPHYWVDEQGEYRGFAREVLDLFAQAEHIELSYRALPVTELAGRLVKGEVDLKYPDSPEWADDVKAGKPMAYSAPVVGYVDGVLVDPKRVGQGIETLRRLALVQGWTPRGYQSRIDEGKVQPVQGSDLRQMIRQALKKQADGAYFNVVVATYYLDNIRARPGALVFDPSLPHTRGTFHLSSSRHPELVQRFDRFLVSHKAEVDALKAHHRVEANLDTEYMGLEQWKVDYLERQKRKDDPARP